MTLVLAGQVKTLNVGLAAVIDEAAFVTVEEAVNAQREELIIVG